MKMNQFVATSAVLCNALAKQGGGAAVEAPAEGVMQGAATEADKAKVEVPQESKESKEDAGEPEAEVIRFAGFPYSPKGLTDLESRFRAAYGRIKPALETRAEAVAKLDKDSRKKAKVRTGKNVLMDVMVTSNPRQVSSVASELVDLGAISRGDADTWIAYVTLAAAFDVANDMGRLL